MISVVANAVLDDRAASSLPIRAIVAGVCPPAWVAATGNLDTQAVAGAETLGGGSEINLDPACTVRLDIANAGSHAHDAVADIDAAPIGVNIAETANQIEEGMIGTNIDAQAHRPDHIEISRQRRASEG